MKLRKLTTWKAQLQREDGQILEVDFASYWDPAKTGDPVGTDVANSAAAMMTVETKQKHIGLTAVLA